MDMDTNSTIEILREASAEQLSALSDLELDGVSGGTTTVGGTALGRGRVITNGGNNLN